MASQLSSTVAIVVATSVVSASTGDKDLTTVDITPKNDAQDVHKVDVSLIHPLDTTGEECNTFISIIADTKDEVLVDVGVLLVGCENKEQECVKDDTSSLGGRCTITTHTSYNDTSAIQRTRQTISKPKLRFLQDTEGLYCPANCPQSFCGCIESFFDGIGEELSNYNSTEEEFDTFGIMKDPTCATEIKSVCSNDEVLTNCDGADGGEEYGGEYSFSDYCPYLTCFIDAYTEGTEVEECYCLSYRLACDVYAGSEYESYVEQYCTIADCCDAQPVGSKATCIPSSDEIDEIIDTIDSTIPDMIDELFDFPTGEEPIPTVDNEEDYLPEDAVSPQGEEEAQDDAPKDDMSTTTDMPAETEDNKEEIPADNTPDEDVGSGMATQTEGGNEAPSDNTAEVEEEEVEEPTSTVSEEEGGEEPTASVNSGRIISGGMTLVALAFVVGMFD